MSHPDVEGIGHIVDVAAFDEVWADLGWVLLPPDPDALAAAYAPPPPVDDVATTSATTDATSTIDAPDTTTPSTPNTEPDTGQED
jgi:hypothetical protein